MFTTQITGNLAQTATGTYGVDVNLDPSADRLNITGTATMSGFVLANLVNPLTAPGFATPGTHDLTILSAAGGETHSNLTLEAFQTAVAGYSLVYPNATDIDLQYVINYSPAGLTQNQHSVGDAVNAIQAAQTSPNFRPIATNLFYLPNVATLGAAYDSLSGEGVSGAQQTAFDANDYFMSTVDGQMQHWLADECGDDAHSRTLYQDPVSGRRDVNPPCLAPRTWRVWVSPFGSSSNYAGNANIGSASVSERGAGIGGGIDYQLSPKALIGAALGGGESSFSAPDRATSGTVDAFHASLYGAWRMESAYVTGVLSYDHFNNSESRRATIPGVTLPSPQFVDGNFQIPGFDERLTGNFFSQSVSGHFEAGYKTNFGAVQATPFAGVEFGSLYTGAFTEANKAGPSVIGLSYAGRNILSLPTFLGLQLDGKTEFGQDMWLSLSARAAWKHEFADDRSTESAFISAPGFDFVVRGARPSRDSVVANLGAKLQLGKTVAIFGNVIGDAGAGSHSLAATGGVSLSW